MLQTESDTSFLYLFTDNHSAAPNDKTSTASTSSSMSNHWQPPAWHHHHTRHAPPPSTAAAHLPAPFVLPSPRHLSSHARPLDTTPPATTEHEHEHYNTNISSTAHSHNHSQSLIHNHQRTDHYESDFSSTSDAFARGDYAHNAYAPATTGQDQRNDAYYSNEATWSYPVDTSNQQQQHGHHHQQQAQQQQSHPYMKLTSELGHAMDPLPLRHVAMPSHVPSAAHNSGFDEDIYEARMLQEALTMPHYARGALGGFHHQQQQQQLHQQPHQHQQHPHLAQFASPFVSAVMDASVPVHHQTHQHQSHHQHPHQHQYQPQHHSHSALASMYAIRPTSTPSEHTIASDSEAASSEHTTSSSSVAGKRKRRGDSAPRLCRVDGCNKGIRSRGLCKAHGGGRRCMTPGCTTSDQGGGHCVLHGGGRRCTVDHCTKSAQWKGLCKMHGGARRCRYQNCTKNGQVKQGYCRAHHNLITKQREQEEMKNPAL